MAIRISGVNYIVDPNPLPITEGGTGQSTAPLAINALLPSQSGQNGKVLGTDGTNVLWVTGGGGGGGTVTVVSVTTANGVSGSVATSTTTPAITLTLGDITPSSVAATGTLSGSNFSGSSSGTNTGDQTNITGNAATVTTNANLTGMVTSVGNATTVVTNANLTGDITSIGNATTLATVNVSPQTDTFRKITVNGKGLTTATSAVSASDITTALTYTPVNKAGDTMLGYLVLNANPAVSLGAATRQYVDTAVAAVVAGVHVHAACETGTVAPLPACTYNNGSSGVGATLTANANGVLPAIGGYTPSGGWVGGERVLIKNQATTLQNGIYNVSVVGAPGGGGSAWVLIRATDFDGTPTSEVSAGDMTYVQEGTLNGTQWVMTSVGTGMPGDYTQIGIDPIVFTQFAGSGSYTAGTGIDITTNVISNTGVTSAVAGTNISVSSGTGAVTIAVTGTVPTATTATNLSAGGANTVVYQSASGTTAYLTNGTTGQILTATTGSAPTWAAMGAAAAGTLTGSTLASGVTASSLTSVGTLGSLAVTGTTTQTGALNLAGASSPLQVGGSAGTSGYVLTSAGAGATPTWQTPSAGAAAAGTLTGTTLASNVVSSSLTSTSATTFTHGSGASAITIQGPTVSGTAATMNLTGGNSSAGQGGAINITAGTSTSGAGGNANFSSGNGSNTGAGGSMVIQAGGGGGVSGNGGSLNINGGGAGQASGNTGGDVFVTSGTAFASGTTAGVLYLQSGYGGTSGTGNSVVIRTGNSGALTYTERFRILNNGAWSVGSSGVAYGLTGQVLTSQGNAAPIWQTFTPSSATNIAGGTTNQIPFQSAAGTTAFGNIYYTSGTNTFQLGNSTGVSTITTSGGSASGGGLTMQPGIAQSGSSGNTLTLSAGDAANSGSSAGGGVMYINAGKGNPTAGGAGGVIVFQTAASATLTERFRILATGDWSVGSAGTNVGSSSQVLTSNGSGTPPTWQGITLGNSTTVGTVVNTAQTITGQAATSAGANPLTIQAGTTSSGSPGTLSILGGSGASGSAAGAVIVQGGTNSSSGNAGAVTIQGGTTTGYSAGAVNILGGTGSGNPNLGGAVNITAGSSSGPGGIVTITGGANTAGAGAGPGGAVTIIGGGNVSTTAATTGGAITITGGPNTSSTGSTVGGAVTLQGGTGTSAGGGGAIIFQTAATTSLTTKMTISNAGNVSIGIPSLATTATNGFPYFPTCAGTPTGVPTAVTGFAPVVIDSTNNKMYFYSGGAWVPLN